MLLVAAPLCAADAGEEFFEKKIRPVLASKCYACHSGAVKEPMGGLRLDTRAGLANRKVVAAVGYQDAALKMPPSGKLPDDVIADFRRWAEMGSPAPADRATGADSKSWAFQPLRKVAPPPVPKGPEASKRVWLRRVTYDLIGLPPTREEIAAFLLDESEGAHEKVVDRLLRSPHYGERWARHWLDLVRFAETNGHEFDNTKQDAWQYRDYVIRAFNEDLPYDRFVKEQIAGDLLPSPRLSEDGAFLESPIGTGIYWFGEVLNSATDSVKSRADQVDNQIDVISKTFLGLTVACARCHDHKFDPIPTADYYALAGIMHSTAIRETVVDSPVRRAEIANMAAIFEPVRPRRIDPLELRPGDQVYSLENWTPAGFAFGPGLVNSGRSGALGAVGSLTSAKFTMPKLWVHVRMRGTKFEGKRREDLRVTVVADEHKSASLFPTGKEGWEWRSARMTKEIGRNCYFEIVDRATDGYIAVDKILISDNEKPPEDEFSAEPWTLSKVRMPHSEWAMVARDENPGNVKLHIRGSHKDLGAEVPRGVLHVVGNAPAIDANSSGRLALAQWIADPANPLTARVMVNRIWKHHFGTGLVRTTDNFGKTGDRPTNPEMLDWLASSFIESGWSVKKLHRQIVLSSTYRAPKMVRRLEGEAIRDAMLAISGRLDRALYGPSVTPHISKYQDGRGKPESGPLDGNGRRSIYIQVRRNFITPMFLAFDYPLPISTIGKRSVSTVPSQALMMMNNELVADLAITWARTVATSGVDLNGCIKRMYEEAFAREPEEWETKEATAFIAKQFTPVTGLQEFAQVLFNSAEFIYVQ